MKKQKNTTKLKLNGKPEGAALTVFFIYKNTLSKKNEDRILVKSKAWDHSGFFFKDTQHKTGVFA